MVVQLRQNSLCRTSVALSAALSLSDWTLRKRAADVYQMVLTYWPTLFFPLHPWPTLITSALDSDLFCFYFHHVSWVASRGHHSVAWSSYTKGRISSRRPSLPVLGGGAEGLEASNVTEKFCALASVSSLLGTFQTYLTWSYPILSFLRLQLTWMDPAMGPLIHVQLECSLPQRARQGSPERPLLSG